MTAWLARGGSGSIGPAAATDTVTETDADVETVVKVEPSEGEDAAGESAAAPAGGPYQKQVP